MKIGDLIYYRESDSLYFHEREIVGETSRSWIVINQDSFQWCKQPPFKHCLRIPKSLKNLVIGTKDEMLRNRWAMQHRHKIYDRLRWETNPEVVFAVARILKYPMPEEFTEDTCKS